MAKPQVDFLEPENVTFGIFKDYPILFLINQMLNFSVVWYL